MIDRSQAQYNFWSSFGLPAYQDSSVPSGAALPYITYQCVTSPFGGETVITASVWTRSASWLEADTIADQIETSLSHGGTRVPYDDGLLWFTADPDNFAQSMGDPNDDMIKRKLITVGLHFA